MRTIAIGALIFVLAHTGAVAQTAAEQARILRDFQHSVANYIGTPGPRMFTPPVAMVFRQLIARAVATTPGAAAINGVGHAVHPTVFAEFPEEWRLEFPGVLAKALPRLPAPLEYRLVANDLVIRDAQTDAIVDVLRDAVGPRLGAIR